MKIKAYAKINLTLDITGKRENGYHELSSVMQTVSLFDTIRIKKADKVSVKCSCGLIEDNIVFKACEEFFKHTGLTAGADIYIKKRIPVSAGLGGGSSDASAVINAFNQLYKTNLDKKELAQIGFKVGADVPYLIYGGSALVEGVGEFVTPLVPLKNHYCVIVKDGEKKSTGDMYKRIDSVSLKNFTTKEFLNCIKQGEFNYSYISNAFNSVAEKENVIEKFKTTNPLSVSVSGSGPSVFGLYRSYKDSLKASKILKNFGFKPIITKFV